MVYLDAPSLRTKAEREDNVQLGKSCTHVRKVNGIGNMNA